MASAYGRATRALPSSDAARATSIDEAPKPPASSLNGRPSRPISAMRDHPVGSNGCGPVGAPLPSSFGVRLEAMSRTAEASARCSSFGLKSMSQPLSPRMPPEMMLRWTSFDPE